MIDTKNMYCDLNDLSNESSVKHFFVARLLFDLGYTDSQIKTKESIDEVAVSVGRKKVRYKPDYILTIRRRPRVVIEAKAPSEKITNWTGQCDSYCYEINKRFEDNPVELFIITNGLQTAVYLWDKEDPELVIEFGDFTEKNVKYRKLIKCIGEKAVFNRIHSNMHKAPKSSQYSKGTHIFEKRSIDNVNYAFSWCHQYIYRKDNISQAAAFNEFIKLMFLKLLSDKVVHEKHQNTVNHEHTFSVPCADVTFSTEWISRLESETANPIADISFIKLRNQLEDEIAVGRTKRMFDRDAQLILSPETIKGVVEKLEHLDLYSIDHDLNGRLFETFLNATMRGKDLGQYFTPRSVVKLMIAVSGLDELQNPVVLDPCCGSGGLLIDALACLWQAVNENPSMTNVQKVTAKHNIAKTNIIGLDVGKEPTVARIARINMYLHGDGGSRIYQADALDKDLEIPERLDPERKQELRELTALVSEGGFANVILTNPPFSKVYQSKHLPEERILNSYDVGTQVIKGNKLPKSSLKSSVMFLERYWDFLAENGRVIAIVDESILGSKQYSDVRDFIRKRYIIEAVISLPGDAFQRSKARVKTSVVILRKKTDQHEEQAAVFMYYCIAVGIDDSPRQRAIPIDRKNREIAQKEIAHVTNLFASFKRGEAKQWTVPASRLSDRLDVKSCLPQTKRLVPFWKEKGRDIHRLSELVQIFDEDNLNDEDVIYTAEASEVVVFLRIRYDGMPEFGQEIVTSDTNYSTLFRVHTNDIVISNINAVHGATAVITPEFDGCVVSNEYTICRARPGFDPRIIWLLVRSPEARSDLLVLSSGIGRTRVQWDNARNLTLALPSSEVVAQASTLLEESENMMAKALAAREAAVNLFNKDLDLNNAKAQALIKAFKPPK